MNCFTSNGVPSEGFKLCIICCLPFALGNQLENNEKISELCEEIKSNHGFGSNVDNAGTKQVCEEMLDLEIRFGISVCFVCSINMNKMLTSKEEMGTLENRVLSLQKEIIKMLQNLEKCIKQIEYHQDILRKTVQSSDELYLKRRIGGEMGTFEYNSLVFKLRQWIVKDTDIRKGKIRGDLSIGETNGNNVQGKVVANANEKKTSNTEFIDLTLDSDDDEIPKIHADQDNVKNLDSSLVIMRVGNPDIEKRPIMNLEERPSSELTITKSKLPRSTGIIESTINNLINTNPISNNLIDQHISKVRYCALCFYSVDSDPSFEQHIRHHENELDPSLKNLQCPVCPLKFSTDQYFQFHLNCHQSSKNDQDEHLNKILFPCQSCEMKFQRKLLLQAHQIKEHGAAKHKCYLCEKEFLYPSSLKNHHKNMHEVLDFRCKICGEPFQNYRFLKKHMSATHGIQGFSCDLCGKRFNSELNLRFHAQVHSDKTKYSWKCIYCGRMFQIKQNLKVHMRIHTGERLFVCEVCGKDFTRSFCLTNHRKRQHRI